MEEIIVNLDYEYQLQGLSKAGLRRSFDYLFFLTDDAKKKCLITDNIFDSDYINYLELLFGHQLFYKNKTSTKGVKATNWWGELRDLERLKKLNDKELALKLNGLEYHKINSYEELEYFINTKLDKKNFFIKSHFSFSGRGNFVFPKQIDLIKKKLISGESLLLMDYFNIEREFGRTFIYRNGKLKMIDAYQNIIENSIYKGSRYNKLFNNKFINEKMQKQLLKLNLNEGDTFQVDGFSYYDEQNKFKNINISEINFRKTMFTFIKGLASKLEIEGELELLIHKNSALFTSFSQKISSYQHRGILFNGKKGIIPVSPISSKFQVEVKIY